jgi:chloride channel protein, CIC family
VTEQAPSIGDQAAGSRIMVPRLNEPQLFLLLAILIGIFSGLAVVCFRVAIEWTRLVLLGPALEPSFPRVVLVPALAGLIVAAAVVLIFPLARGSGVHQTKAAVYISNGFIPFRTVIAKFVTCALAIGGGHSLGPEDPSLQIGAGLASLFGRNLELSREKLRLIAPVGAAAGLAAAFNSPITAVLFVVEEVIGTWSAGALGAIVLSAVAAVVTEQWFLGGAPLFRVPAFELAHPLELLSYAALGAAGGCAALVFVKLATTLRPRLRALPGWTHFLQPAIAGAIIGAIGIWYPQVMGAGYEHVDDAMHDQYAWGTLAVLAGLKMLATVLSFTSGTPGGLFAPTLFTGAMLGGAVCGIARIVAPDVTGPIGAYALVGMGTLFAGILRAPMTSVFMMVEVSGNYSIVLPVMISNSIAYMISRRFQPTPIFEVLSHQDGIVLPSMEEQRETRLPRVEDAMRETTLVLDGGTTVADARGIIEGAPDGAVPVLLTGAIWATVSEHELEALDAGGRAHESLQQALGPEARVAAVHRDQPLDTALRLLRNRPLLPVVHRAQRTRIEGVVTLEDILAVYRSGDGL